MAQPESKRSRSDSLTSSIESELLDEFDQREQRRNRLLEQNGSVRVKGPNHLGGHIVPSGRLEPGEMPESYRVSHKTRPSGRYGAGVDTLRLIADDFTVSSEVRPDSSDHEWSFGTTETGGRDNAVPLFRCGGSGQVVERGKAYRNGSAARFTVRSVDCLIVEASMPKALRGENGETLRREKTFGNAVAALEREACRVGVSVDLASAQVSRLDVARTVEFDDAVPAFGPVLRALQFPRTERQRYEGTGFRWRNSSRQLVFYDKGREEEDEVEASRRGRLEYRLTGSEAVQQHTDIESTLDLMDNLDTAVRAYADAAERLVGGDVSTLSKQAVTTADAFHTLLSMLEGERGADKKAMQALAYHRMSVDEREALVKARRETKGRQAAHRLRKRMKRLRPLAGVFEQADRSEADLYRELQSRLCL